jgi:putative ABC transport system ATP-binding protein
MLELEGACKFYASPGETVHAVQDVSLTVKPGESVAIFGPSGSGKTTLLLLAAGLLRADEGRVRFEESEITEFSNREMLAYRRNKLGFVFQAFNLAVGLTAAENVRIPLLLRGVDHHSAHKRALDALGDVELRHRAGHTPDMLSGGEQQRVGIARALVGDPKLILADEPTGNLDSETSETVLELLRTLTRQRGAAAVIVTHDAIAAGYADRALTMLDGRLNVGEAQPSPVAGE